MPKIKQWQSLFSWAAVLQELKADAKINPENVWQMHMYFLWKYGHISILYHNHVAWKEIYTHNTTQRR